MFTDSAGLLIAMIAASLALKPATLKRTWGYKRAGIVAAAGQAALLLGVTGTPTFFLNGEKLTLNSEAQFRRLLDDAAK